MTLGPTSSASDLDRDKSAVELLIEPMLEELGAHLSAFPAKTRLCLELALASRFLSIVNARVLVDGQDKAAERLIAIGSEVDATWSDLCTGVVPNSAETDKRAGED